MVSPFASWCERTVKANRSSSSFSESGAGHRSRREASTASSPTRVPIAGLVGSAGNLDELRQLTAAKFAKLGVVLDDEGKVVRGLANGNALTRPAAAIAEDGSDDTEDASSAEGIALKRPALSMRKTQPSSSDSTDKTAVGMQPG